MGARKTRIVFLEDGQDRREAENLRTGVVVSDREGRMPFRELFTAAWPEMRRVIVGFDQPGVAVVAVDSVKRRVAGTLCLAAKDDRANAATVGRHGQCDLYLHSDPALSLRHLAIVVHPIHAAVKGGDAPAGRMSGEIAFRVLDLRTRTAFKDEQGRRLEAVTAEGPVFLQVGGYALFFLVTGDEGLWPEDADQAWQCIPERVYLDEAPAEPDRWRRRRGIPIPVTPDAANPFAAGTGVHDTPPPPREAITLVRTQPGPARAQVELRLDDGELPLGTLRLTSGGMTQAMLLGAHAAQTGVLLGRYERCDTHGATVFAHHGISRVHLLIVEIEGRLYAMDTGSTNGTFETGGAAGPLRIVPLGNGSQLIFGDNLARMEWLPP